MKLISLTCTKCNATLSVDAEQGRCKCEYCGNEMLIDPEVIHMQYDNMYQAGYQAEMGRQAAMYQAQQIAQNMYLQQQQAQEQALKAQQKERLKRLAIMYGTGGIILTSTFIVPDSIKIFSFIIGIAIITLTNKLRRG